MRTLRTIILLSLMVPAANLALATATTHIWGPATDVQPFKVLHVTADMYLPTQLDALPGDVGVQLPPVTNLGLTCGVLPTKEVQLEVGVDHKAGFGAFDRYPLYFNAKLGVPENTLMSRFPALAVGVFDVGTESDKTDYNVVYGKAAMSFEQVGRLSVGFFSGNDKLLLDSEGEKSNTGLLAAWERSMPEISDKLWLCLEYVGSNSAYGTMNIGGSWKFADNASILLGYDILNDADLAGVENYFTAQVDIDLNIR
ncbi:hypothetical protein HZB60_02555 [candidate division KSB1 bacterium]|nr:hypothetical protein [candidate division KSB1 bacterium]